MSDLPPIEDDGPDEDGDHAVPPELIELSEVLEWQRAVEAQG